VLSLCTIVRNEAATLHRCIGSVQGLVDEIVLVDTGSSDGTPAMAADLGAKVTAAPWQNSFAAARNEALRHASGRWILWLDADEALRPGEHHLVRRLLRPGRIGAYLVEIVNYRPGEETPQRSTGHRLFRRLPGVFFEGRVHEQIAPSIERLGLHIGRAEFTIDHYGYAGDEDAMQAKRQRNLALLHEQLRDDQRDSYAWMHLAQTLMQVGEHATAEEALQQALAGRTLPHDLLASLHNNRAECRLKLKDPQGALAACECSLAIFRRQIMANALAYQACTVLGDRQRALAHLHAARQAALSPPPVGERPSIEAQMSLDKIDRAIANCTTRASPQEEAAALERLRAGDLEGALQQLRRLESQNPQNPILRRYVPGILVKLGRRQEAAQYLAAATRAP